MSTEPIKAFVGHSFSPADDEVVRKFLSCLDRAAELQANFSWEDAEHPEAALVDQKVLAKFADKNVFIGICTAKERTIDNKRLTKGWYRRGRLSAPMGDFGWKTSDWIIQEIGVALGRGMKVILLIEQGTSPPGELQGNVEFIPFSRTALDPSFDKLLGMIASLTPRTTSPHVSTAEKVETEKTTEPAKPETDEFYLSNPKPDWTVVEFEYAMMQAIKSGEKELEEKINAYFLASGIGAGELNRRRWSALIEFFRVYFNRGGQFAELKKLAEAALGTGDIWAYVGRTYARYGEFSNAVGAFERAGEFEPDQSKQMGFLHEAARAAQKSGNAVQTDALLTRIRAFAGGPAENEQQILRVQAELAAQTNDSEIRVAALERLLEIDPSDSESRFNLAYKYGELNMNSLSALHYSRIPVRERNETSWNNLGATLDDLELPVRSVQAYLESKSLGGTLAMANLAGRLLRAGFLRESEELLNEAAKQENHHKSVDTWLGDAKEAEGDEDKKAEQIFAKARIVSAFHQTFGRALARLDIRELPSLWEGPTGDLRLGIEGDQVTMSGSYEVGAYGALTLALLTQPLGSILAPPQAEEKVRYRIEFRGTIRGRTIIGKVTRGIPDQPPKSVGLLGAPSEPKPFPVLMWVHDDSTRIAVAENMSADSPKFYDLTARS